MDTERSTLIVKLVKGNMMDGTAHEDKKAVGQAYSKDNRYIYTWYTDGTATRTKAEGFMNNEPVDRSVVWNDKDFWEFVRVAHSDEITDIDEMERRSYIRRNQFR